AKWFPFDCAYQQGIHDPPRLRFDVPATFALGEAMRQPVLPAHHCSIHEPQARHTTTRLLIVLKPGAVDAAIRVLRNQGFSVAESGQTKESLVSQSEAADVDVLIFRDLGIGLVS